MLKDLNRLKQSARLWFDLFGEQSRKIGFVRSDYDHALYLNANGRFITVYVNNIHLIGPDLSLMEEMMSKLSSKFKMTDIGKTSHYLGIGVYRNWDVGIFTVTQTAYIDQLHQMSLCNSSPTPIVKSLLFAPASKEFNIVSEDVSSYKKFIGAVYSSLFN